MPLCNDQPPPSAQSASRAASSKKTSVSTLVARRRDAAASARATAASPLRTGSPAAADRRVSSSPSTSMLQHRHAPSPDEHQLANPATSSARVNPSRSASSATTAPTPRTFLDPWNSSSTGHQRAENRLSGSTSWRSSRNLKLGEQYRGGLSGGSLRVADTVGAGSEDFDKDGRKPNGGWQKGASGLRMGGQKSLTEVWGASKASAMAKKSLQEEESSKHVDPLEDVHEDRLEEHSSSDIDPEVTLEPTQKQIFRGLCFYLNGSTAPLISDHKLKHLLSAHGAGYSIALGRRTVTHVILGTTCGGGLSGSKLQKEITKKGGKSVKFITADWVLESIAASKRLPESHFAPLKLAPKGQKSVFPNQGSAQPPAG